MEVPKIPDVNSINARLRADLNMHVAIRKMIQDYTTEVLNYIEGNDVDGPEHDAYYSLCDNIEKVRVTINEPS